MTGQGRAAPRQSRPRPRRIGSPLAISHRHATWLHPAMKINCSASPLAHPLPRSPHPSTLNAAHRSGSPPTAAQQSVTNARGAAHIPSQGYLH